MKTHLIKISKRTGTIEVLGDSPFKLHNQSKQRFSEIVPVNCALLWLFRAIRKRFGDESKMAAFTRRWPCLWRMVILMGPSKGFVQFGRNRSRLIEIEKEIFHSPKFEL